MGFPECPSFQIEPGSLLHEMLLTEIPIIKPMNGLPPNKFEYIHGVLSIKIPDQSIGLISESDIDKILKDI
jgi:hypothetical protein